MARSRRLIVLQAVVLAAVFSGSAVLAIAAAAAGRAHHAASTTLSTEKTKKLGKVIDVSGRAVYLFAKDKNGKSSCNGGCASAWPPLIASGKVTVAKGSGLNAKLVGKVKRSDGKMQVTYNHHPLYYYSRDKKSGDTKGEGVNAFGARWYLVNAKGNAVKPKKGACNPLCPGY